MKRTWLTVVGVALLGAATAAGQGVRYGVGAGLLLPISDYSDIDKAGWIVGADITYWLASARIGIRAEGSYSQTSQKAGACCLTDHKTKIAGGMVDVVYAFGRTAGRIRPYLLGGVGFYNVKFTAPGFASSSNTKIGFGGGAGVACRVGAGSTRIFVEGKVTSVTVNGVQIASVPIRVGLRFAST